MKTTTQYAPTGAQIGRCVKCRKAYVAQTSTAGMWCACRAESGHPQTFIRWTAVVAKPSTRKCTGACTSAKSEKCACECDGQNHGKDLDGLAVGE